MGEERKFRRKEKRNKEQKEKPLDQTDNEK
jgi:hypothetical protein